MERDEGYKRLRDSFGNLIGMTIVDVVVQPSADFRDMRPDIGLVVEHPLAAAKVKGCGRLVVWASQDAEGNGPGWLEVEEVKS
jgi:hypothetical protein